MWSFSLITFLAGFLTIASPCILPILPFVLSRTDLPFQKGSLPVLLGLAISFAVVASLAAVAGGWAVAANRHGRTLALAATGIFGLAMLLPGLAAAMSRPAVWLGVRLAAKTGKGTGVLGSLLLGVATGLVWTPCAGPVLGLILTGAALHGPSLETSLLLLAYATGAATALALGLVVGRRLLSVARRSMGWGDHLRRIIGAGVVAGTAALWLGLDASYLNGWSAATLTDWEQALLATRQTESAMIVPAAQASPAPTVPGPLASLLTARHWLNAPAPQPGDLAGKVVVVNFWTYSCINCIRALPHVRTLARRYAERGLVVIGVHTPEFAFEKDAENVRMALQTLGIAYPVVSDNDFAIWRAFGNRGWPGLYIFGSDGRLRHSALGEGGYEQSERIIRQLLHDQGAAPAERIIGLGPQAEPDPGNLRSSETYLGYAQTSGFASPGGVREDTLATYQGVSALGLNRWSLSGDWTVGREFATLNAAGGRIAYRFHARDLHLVLVPGSAGRAIRFRVTINGAPPGDAHGTDVTPEGWGSVQDGRLYQLIRQTGAVQDRTFEIEFVDEGVRAYAFTFG